MELDQYIEYADRIALEYQDVDEAYLENQDTNPHHFHHYDSGQVVYKKQYLHLYKLTNQPGPNQRRA